MNRAKMSFNVMAFWPSWGGNLPAYQRRCCVCLLAVLVVGIASCEQQETQTPNKKNIYGIAVKQNNKLIMFASNRKDVAQALQESLGGIEKNEKWWRVDVDTAVASVSSSDVSEFDLAKDKGITIVERQFVGDPQSPAMTKAFTYSYPSTGSGVSGRLRISPPGSGPSGQVSTSASDGQLWTFSYSLAYKGIREAFGDKWPIELHHAFGAAVKASF